jgi:hypothetical protein
VCASEQRKHGHEQDAQSHEDAAEEAGKVLSGLQGEELTLAKTAPSKMVSPNGEHEEKVTVAQYTDHITVETRTGKQVVMDLGDDGAFRADFHAPSGPAGGDAETHVEMTSRDVSVTNNY